MKETKFMAGFSAIGEGLAEVLYSCWLVVSSHKLLCAFIISLLLNVILSVRLGEARAERDNRDSVAYVMEKKVDSLKLIK